MAQHFRKYHFQFSVIHLKLIDNGVNILGILLFESLDFGFQKISRIDGVYLEEFPRENSFLRTGLEIDGAALSDSVYFNPEFFGSRIDQAEITLLLGNIDVFGGPLDEI